MRIFLHYSRFNIYLFIRMSDYNEKQLILNNIL